MNSDILKPITGHDVGIQVDMFGNETIHITKSKGVIQQTDIETYLKEQKLSGVIKQARL